MQKLLQLTNEITCGYLVGDMLYSIEGISDGLINDGIIYGYFVDDMLNSTY
jgi:hypothetical protein